MHTSVHALCCSRVACAQKLRPRIIAQVLHVYGWKQHAWIRIRGHWNVWKMKWIDMVQPLCAATQPPASSPPIGGDQCSFTGAAARKKSKKLIYISSWMHAIRVLLRTHLQRLSSTRSTRDRALLLFCNPDDPSPQRRSSHVSFFAAPSPDITYSFY